MRRMVCVLGLALLNAAPAAAKDFTGFYAGVNAGWGFGRDHEAVSPSVTRSVKPEEGLPPSVARVQAHRVAEPSRAMRGR